MPPFAPKDETRVVHHVHFERQESLQQPPDYPPPLPPLDDEEDSDVVEPRASCKTTDWLSIYVASFLAVCGAVQTSLYWSSLWPYLQVIDPTSTETFFGYVVGLRGLGQMVGSPLMGYWSDRSKKVSTPLLMGLALMFTGNGVYLCAKLLPTYGKYVIMLSRFIVGIGSSNISLLRAYACTASTTTDRSTAIAFVVGGNAIGMSLGPGLQMVTSPVGYPGWVLSGNFSLNMYTVPSVLACCMNVVGALAICFLFREYYAGVTTDKRTKKPDGVPEEPLPPFDPWAVALCNIARFAQKLVTAHNDTVSVPFAMAMFAFSRSDVLQYVSLAQSLRGFVAFLVYVAYVTLKVEKRFKRLDYRINCMVSLGGLALFFLLTFSWPFVPGHVRQYYSGDDFNASLGCNATKFDWCASLSPVNVYVYYVAYIVLIGISFPNLNIALTTLLSRILGPRRQGAQHGILQCSEGVSRMVGPVVISMLYAEHGPRAAWLLQIASLSIVMGLWAVSYTRLVPLEQRVSKELAEKNRAIL